MHDERIGWCRWCGEDARDCRCHQDVNGRPMRGLGPGARLKWAHEDPDEDSNLLEGEMLEGEKSDP